MTHAATGSPWWRTAVFYEVYLRSFADADGDGVGDLEGLRQRLPYLADLGVDALCAEDPGFCPGISVRDREVVSAPVAEAFVRPAVALSVSKPGAS